MINQIGREKSAKNQTELPHIKSQKKRAASEK